MARKRHIVILLLLVLATPVRSQVSPSAKISEESWIKQVTNIYLSEKDLQLPKLEGVRQSGASVVTRLSRLYKRYFTNSIRSTAVAYYGALTCKNPDIWVEKMVARTRQGLAGEEEREFLPIALEKVYQRRESARVIKHLVQLSLDAAPGEVLDAVRFRLFLQHPRSFAFVLQEKSLRALRTEIQNRKSPTFTSIIVFRLQGNPKRRVEMTQLRKRFRQDNSPIGRFLDEYISMLLNGRIPLAKT